MIVISLSVYLILGHTYEHIGLIVAMEELKLFDNGKTFFSSPTLSF